MRVPFFDLRILDEGMKKELLASVDRVLSHGRLILGPEVEEFERRVAEQMNVKHAVGVASGSSALFMGLQSLGIEPGDEVITTPLTWIITLNAIAACGATPICVDVGEDFNIDPAKIEAAITDKTKAIVPMHYCGYLCDMPAIRAIADRHNLQIIEDAAQAYGATRHNIKPGELSDAAIFSLNTMKVLACYGEAGVLITNDEKIAEHVRMLRYAGTKSDPKKIITNECYYPALNHKMDTIQASMLLVAMDHLPERMRRRREIAERYNAALRDYYVTPTLVDGDVHALYSYALQVPDREALLSHLVEHQIENKIYHTPLAHQAPIYRDIAHPPTPVAERLVNETLSIPAHEKLTDEQVDYVIDKMIEFARKHGLESRKIESVGA